MELDLAQQRHEAHLLSDALSDEKFQVFYKFLKLLVEPTSTATSNSDVQT